MDNSKAKEQVVKSATLLYFNRELLKKQMITEQEYRQMVHLIRAKYPDPR